MKTYDIKGLCEYCGFAYKGTIGTEADGVSFARIECPNCGKETENFDEAHEIDELDVTEGNTPSYVHSEFKAIS